MRDKLKKTQSCLSLRRVDHVRLLCRSWAPKIECHSSSPSICCILNLYLPILANLQASLGLRVSHPAWKFRLPETTRQWMWEKITTKHTVSRHVALPSVFPSFFDTTNVFSASLVCWALYSPGYHQLNTVTRSDCEVSGQDGTLF